MTDEYAAIGVGTNVWGKKGKREKKFIYVDWADKKPDIFTGLTQDKGFGIHWFKRKRWLLIYLSNRFVLFEFHVRGE